MWQIHVDMKESYIAVFEGPITLKLQNNRSPTYRLQASRVSLHIPQKAISVINQNRDHAVYYTPQSKTVLAIEEL